MSIICECIVNSVVDCLGLLLDFRNVFDIVVSGWVLVVWWGVGISLLGQIAHVHFGRISISFACDLPVPRTSVYICCFSC